jgi:hypothetical protein
MAFSNLVFIFYASLPRTLKVSSGIKMLRFRNLHFTIFLGNAFYSLAYASIIHFVLLH